MIILFLVGVYFSCGINLQDIEPIQSDCVTNGGNAGDSGLKTWCWAEIPVPTWDGDGNNFFLYKDEIKISNHDRWYENQITNDGDRLKLHLNPTTPAVHPEDSSEFNYRIEVRTNPWDIQQPLGTEEWFGWNYGFGDDYVIDQANEWLFFQVHNGIVGYSPQLNLEIVKDGASYADYAGELVVINRGNRVTGNSDYRKTGIVPHAGDNLDIVIHVIWANADSGMLKVWVNGNIVYDKQVSTVYADSQWGGNAKWGIYKWPWKNADDVQNTLDQGIDHLQTSMGSLRVITRYPGDPDYGTDSYELVKPR